MKTCVVFILLSMCVASQAFIGNDNLRKYMDTQNSRTVGTPRPISESTETSEMLRLPPEWIIAVCNIQ